MKGPFCDPKSVPLITTTSILSPTACLYIARFFIWSASCRLKISVM